MNQKKRYIYADNAATSPLSQKAYEAMVPFLVDEFGNAHWSLQEPLSSIGGDIK